MTITWGFETPSSETLLFCRTFAIILHLSKKFKIHCIISFCLMIIELLFETSLYDMYYQSICCHSLVKSWSNNCQTILCICWIDTDNMFMPLQLYWVYLMWIDLIDHYLTIFWSFTSFKYITRIWLRILVIYLNFRVWQSNVSK